MHCLVVTAGEQGLQGYSLQALFVRVSHHGGPSRVGNRHCRHNPAAGFGSWPGTVLVGM